MIDVLEFFDTLSYKEIEQNGVKVKAKLDNKCFPHVLLEGENYKIAKFDFLIMIFCLKVLDLLRYYDPNNMSGMAIKNFVSINERYHETSTKSVPVKFYISKYSSIDAMDTNDGYYMISSVHFNSIRAALRVLRYIMEA